MVLDNLRRKKPVAPVETVKIRLPLELWIGIASYLPKEFYYKLLGIDRQLFNWIMDRLYEDVEFSLDRDTGDIRKPNVEQLRYPSIVRCVRTMRISFCHPYKSYHVRAEGSFGKRILDKFAHKKLARNIANEAPSGIDGSLFTGVTFFALCFDYLAFSRPFIPLFSSFWHANAQNLQTLILQLDMKDLHSIIHPLLEGPVSLPNLIEFTFFANHDRKFRDPALFPRSQVDQVTHWITSLVLSAREFLQKLNLILPPNIDTTYLFSELAKYPSTKLRRLVFSQACGVDSFPMEQSFSHFLVTHCEHSLDELVIEPFLFYSLRGSNIIQQRESYVNWLTQEFGNLRLPSLRTLQFGVAGWPQHIQETLFTLRNGEFFLSRHSNNLTSLFLLAQHLDFRQLAVVTSAFASDRSSLQYLHFSTDDLTPECLDLLAKDLPRLKCLAIHCNLAIQAPGGVGIQRLWVRRSARDSLLFTTQMEGRLYTQWALRRFQIAIHRIDARADSFDYHQAVKDAFSKSIPSATIIVDQHPELKYFDNNFNLEDFV